MHIALAAREYAPGVDLGGIGAYTAHLATGLRELNHRVTVLSGNLDGANPNAARRALPSLNRSAGRWQELKQKFALGSVRRLWYSFQLERQINRIRANERLDTVEFPDWGAEGFALSRSKSIPVAIKLHTPRFVLDQYENQSPSLDARITDWLERETIRKADLLTSPSASLAQIVSKQYQLPLERIQILRYPIDDRVFHPNIESRKVVKHTPMVLYVGRLNKRKGIYGYARALPLVARACPNAKFLFVGPDMPTTQYNTTHQQELGKLIEQYELESRVQFLPRQTREHLVSLYQQSAVCVVPSLYDNLPYACLEAMACARPVVASAVGGMAEIIETGKNGILVPPNEPEALAQQLIALLRDCEQQEYLGQNARRYIEENLSCARIAQAAVDSFAAILN